VFRRPNVSETECKKKKIYNMTILSKVGAAAAKGSSGAGNAASEAASKASKRLKQTRAKKLDIDSIVKPDTKKLYSTTVSKADVNKSLNNIDVDTVTKQLEDAGFIFKQTDRFGSDVISQGKDSVKTMIERSLRQTNMGTQTYNIGLKKLTISPQSVELKSLFSKKTIQLGRGFPRFPSFPSFYEHLTQPSIEIEVSFPEEIKAKIQWFYLQVYEKRMKASAVVEFLDKEIQIDSVSDGCKNGLQLEGKKKVEKIAIAVDISLKTIKKDNQCHPFGSPAVCHGIPGGIPV
jgi:hypothetical protein